MKTDMESTRNERLAQAATELADAVERIATSEDGQAMLDFHRRLPTYSARNTIWLMAQAAARGEDPQAFAGFRAWQAMGHQVRKGEHGYHVLAPVTYRRKNQDQEEHADASDNSPTDAVLPPKVLVGFTVATVFSAAQTDGPPLPTGASAHLLAGEGPDGAWDALSRLVKEAGYEVELGGEGWPPSCNGQSDFASRTVTVAAERDPAQQVKTLAHELAHIRLGHEAAVAFGHRGVQEVEAESVAYQVCCEMGMDTSDYSVERR